MASTEAMVTVQLNGKPFRVRQGQSLRELVELLGYQGKRIAIEHNHAIVARGRYDECRLGKDDKIEIVQAIGGG